MRTARAAGRLRTSVLPDNRGYDPALAVQEWRAATDPRQQRKVTAATDAAAASDARRKGKAGPAKLAPAKACPARAAAPRDPAPEPRGTEDLHARLAAHRTANQAKAAPRAGADEDDQAGVDGRTIADVRRDMLLVEEQAQLLALAAQLRSVIPSLPTRAGVQTLARKFRDANLRLPDQYGAQIAAELNVDRHACHVVLDKYTRLLFETTIAAIDVMKIFNDEDDAGDDTA